MTDMHEGKQRVTGRDRPNPSTPARKEMAQARRAALSTAIGEAFTVVGIPRSEAAQRLGVSEAAVSYWVAGQRVPDPDTVFALEQLLGCAPGELSRHLGYVPAEAGRTPVDVVAAVQACGLSPASKTRLIDLYRFLCHHEAENARLAAELEAATKTPVKGPRRPSSDEAPGPPPRSL